MSRSVRIKKIISNRTAFLDRLKAKEIAGWKSNHKRDCKIKRIEKSIKILESEMANINLI